ncbi:hypothetical protein [Paenibacillus sp. YYML68]|uniref:hypothetical protein n=1 Tax=Paenibacillus sp. YYML68 TaxID=2909250 RepID=UPI002490254C|nr:hypothetical protein [Paenibacillus sp. YYML68]
MRILYLIIGAYLAYYTISYARVVWVEGNRLAGAVIFLLALALLPLAYVEYTGMNRG